MGDGRIFCAFQPELMQKMGYSVAHLHRQPLHYPDDGLIPRRPANGFQVEMKVGEKKIHLEMSSPIPQAHYASPSAVGDRQQVFNPATLKRCTWPRGRKEMLRAAAEVSGADPFELFPNEYAQCANAGQVGNALNAKGQQMERGMALDSISGTEHWRNTDEQDPAWKVAKGVKYNRFRAGGTPYRSVRWRATSEDAELVKKDKEKKGRTMQEELDWISAGEKRFKVDPDESSTIPKALRDSGNSALLKPKKVHQKSKKLQELEDHQAQLDKLTAPGYPPAAD